jgi:hypothetical protein
MVVPARSIRGDEERVAAELGQQIGGGVVLAPVVGELECVEP